ncbi:MAG: exodeoxyribonuclease VII small subunit [Planctomycetota bacterium]|nr:exodeoxyribonuclease VII small subunit [Planctomycetota bacterium]
MALTPKKTDVAPASGFDARLARLEAIVVELEGGGLALETSIDRYQEGVALLGDCRTILLGFQKRVEELSQDAEGALRPYAGDPDHKERA